MGKIITIPSDTTVQGALETMLENKLRSVISFKDVNDPKSICCIEMSDILKIILDLYSESDMYIEKDFMYILRNSDHSSLRKLRAIDVSNIAGNASFAVVQEGSSILSVASIMGTRGVRRVLVINDAGVLVNIITQSSVLELLMENRQELGPKLDQTLFQLGCGGKPVISIKAGESTIVGFRKIVDNRFTAVAVVDDETEELIGSISLRDIESLVHLKQRIKILYERADMFIRENSNHAQGQGVSCTPLSTMREVLEKMHASDSRRLWICNKKKVPIGVVTITDIIELISPDNNSAENV
ncbi:uncharacterized protein LOC126316932 [Schistocerca gregaria]|uniref:uncharacterized protein LOC126316932 n=1 Tax=Schistocerca gregaria TaxID=7010 RepID=UPI00211DCBB7|nr:uncharacterized protein LOC126316932 [Schistocerca gregaria]